MEEYETASHGRAVRTHRKFLKKRREAGLQGISYPATRKSSAILSATPVLSTAKAVRAGASLRSKAKAHNKGY